MNERPKFVERLKMESVSSIEVSKSANIGVGTKVWHNSKICDEAEIGMNSIIGRAVYIGPGVEIGNNCKIQNSALIYEPAKLGDGVFIGPGVVLTNDLNPRAITSNLNLKTPSDWTKQGVTILDGASLGAGTICVAPVTIGKWAMVGAGSVVLKDVKDFALVVGNPAVQIGWVGREGFKLIEENENQFLCKKSGERYFLHDGVLTIE